jgi:hypothetical protein
MQKKEKISEDTLAVLKQQLLIEDEGLELISQLILDRLDLEMEIDDFGNDPFREGTEHRIKLEKLLAENAHLGSNVLPPSLIIPLLKLNSRDGIDLLHQHQMNTRGYDFTHDTLPIMYAIKNNREDDLFYLLSLNPEYFQSDGDLALMRSSELGHVDMVLELIRQGINPNASFHYDQRTGSRLKYPVIGGFIKTFYHSKMMPLLNHPKIFLNRESSPFKRNSTLMTAIDYGNLEAAMMLLATFRINLDLKNQSNEYEKEGITAYALAVSKKQQDIADIIEFLQKFQDMNHYLESKQLPVMHHFVHIQDDHEEPTIHFMHSDIKVLQVLMKSAHFRNATIHQENNYFYIRLGSYRLNKVIQNSNVTEFLLTHTKDSIFWKIRSSYYRQLQLDLLRNQKTILTLMDLPDIHTLAEKDYYQRLIRESAGIKTLALVLNDIEPHQFQWFLQTLSGHDEIETVALQFSTDTADAIWNQALDLMFSLTSLKNIELQNVPMAKILEIFSKYSVPVHCKFVLNGMYSVSD